MHGISGTVPFDLEVSPTIPKRFLVSPEKQIIAVVGNVHYFILGKPDLCVVCIKKKERWDYGKWSYKAHELMRKSQQRKTARQG